MIVVAQILYMAGSLAFFVGTLMIMGRNLGWW